MFSFLQTYYGADGIDIDSIQDPTQQAAMKTMVRTYGQMPLQLFREPHPPRTKTTVLTMFRMRIGSALKRFTTSSPFAKLYNPYIWNAISIHRFRFAVPNNECDFIGSQGREILFADSTQVDRTPEKIVSFGNGEVVLTELQALFFQNTSPAHSSLLVTWAKWDNSLTVRSMLVEPAVVRLHPHPLNRVCVCMCAKCVYMYCVCVCKMCVRVLCVCVCMCVPKDSNIQLIINL